MTNWRLRSSWPKTRLPFGDHQMSDHIQCPCQHFCGVFNFESQLRHSQESSGFMANWSSSRRHSKSVHCFIIFFPGRENNLPSNRPFRALIFWIRDKHKTYELPVCPYYISVCGSFLMAILASQNLGLEIEFDETGSLKNVPCRKIHMAMENFRMFHGRHIFKWLDFSNLSC